MNVAQFVCGLFLPTTNIHVNADFNHCHLFLFLGQWLAEGTLHLDAASSARYSPLTLRVARLFLRYLSPKLPLPSTNNDKPSPIDGCDGRVELLRYIPQLPLLIAQVAPLLGPVKALFETHIIPSLRDSKPTYADLVLLNEMIRHSHLLSLRMTAVLQQAEYLRVALSAVNADALWSPVITNNDGDTTETASLWNSSMLDGWAGSHEKLARVHAAFDHLVKAENGSGPMPEPVGVRFLAPLGLACKASFDEFATWCGPVWLSLATYNRQLIRERDINIAMLEYLLHEREW
nr:uncharacterized protein CTRU02_15556 [Colletotrichum truncatum]KAF6780935.1 hypothetical protein CTRU02_15556 [Colletotrichum truncatum]